MTDADRGGRWIPVHVDLSTQKAFDRRFRRNARFYADENVEPVVVEILRDLGFEVLVAADVGLVRRDDRDHFAFAKRKDRILLSYDRDFLDDRKFPPHRCSGVVVLDIQPLTRQTLADSIYLLKTVVRPYRDLWRGAKILITKERQMTVWQQDHDSGKRTKTRFRLRNDRVSEEWAPEHED